MKRREFVRRLGLLGATSVLAPLLDACAGEAPTPALSNGGTAPSPTSRATASPIPPTAQPPAPTGAAPQPASPTAAASATATATPPAGTTKVALVQTADRAGGVRRAIGLLGTNPVRGNRVVLKPNFNSADPAPGSTHPDILRALITELQDLGAKAITLAERSGMGDTRAVMQRAGAFDLAGELSFEVVVANELAEADWVQQVSPDYHWSRGFAVPRLLLDADCVVQTCNLKTHRYGGHFTLSLKNSVGLAAKTVPGDRYNYMDELHGSPYQRTLIAEINTAYAPALIVVDGVQAFVNGGPAQGKTVAANVVLAGTDRVAIDAVGVAILRLLGTTPEVSRGTVFEQEQIARAVELGLGVDSPDKIELVTGDEAGRVYAETVRAALG